ncbi:hypothetical protein [Microbacterium esteraromaticum]|uniref:hypothetical protein n=1 Tax=Microbacterium esteraromaticum TaxID=57043 RepID=UPI00195CF8CC|nr:hypothetical protein [Microbacterium esteraromaticum]MBM7467009.1 hypothetical protein [Microbacterium esteraromaticum]
MSENQAPEIPSRVLSAPPGLQLIGADAAGLCADGHCVVPAAGQDAGSAEAATADKAAASAHQEPDAGASGTHSD